MDVLMPDGGECRLKIQKESHPVLFAKECHHGRVLKLQDSFHDGAATEEPSSAGLHPWLEDWLPSEPDRIRDEAVRRVDHRDRSGAGRVVVLADLFIHTGYLLGDAMDQ